MPTIASALIPVLTSVRTLLNVASYLALSTGGLYNDVPERSSFPYTTVGDATEAPFAAFGNHGASCTLVVKFFSQFRGDLQAMQMANEARLLLDQQVITVAGYVSAFIAHELTQTVEEPPLAGVRTRYLSSTYRVEVLPA